MHVNEMNTQGAWLWHIEQPSLATELSSRNSSVVSIAAVDTFETAARPTVFDNTLGVDAGYDSVYRSGTVQERFSAVMTRLADNPELFHDVFESASLEYDAASVESIRLKTVDGAVTWQLQPVMVERAPTSDPQAGLEVGGLRGVDGEAAADAARAPVETSTGDAIDVLYHRVREFLRDFSVRSVLDGLASA